MSQLGERLTDKKPMLPLQSVGMKDPRFTLLYVKKDAATTKIVHVLLSQHLSDYLIFFLFIRLHLQHFHTRGFSIF